jgi:poly(3-hydroxybutyrate) depolymerase
VGPPGVAPPGDGAAGAGDGAAGETGPTIAPATATRSAGCDLLADQDLGKYVTHPIAVPNVAPGYDAAYASRVYWLRLPKTYDPGRSYKTVFLGPGCGASGDSAIPMQQVSKEDAILVGMNGAIGNCFDHEKADTPDLPYFDAILAAVEARVCVDPSQVFVAGFSSGSWLTNYLGCARGDRLRATGSVAGGLPPIPPTCTGALPAMFATDTDDTKNSPTTVQRAVDRVRAVNGCGDTTKPYDFGVPAPCVQYDGCRAGFPVVLCTTSGVGHADQSTTRISTDGFWHFWTSLPPRAP